MRRGGLVRAGKFSVGKQLFEVQTLLKVKTKCLKNLVFTFSIVCTSNNHDNLFFLSYSSSLVLFIYILLPFSQARVRLTRVVLRQRSDRGLLGSSMDRI